MEENIIENIVKVSIGWIVVPAIFIALFLLAISFMNKAQKGEHKLSTVAGFWAGMIVFVVFLIYHLSSIALPDFSTFSSINFNFWDTIILILAVGGGYGSIFGIEKFWPTRIAGFVVMIITFCSLSALFSYFFIQVYNKILLLLALGFTFGVLLHVIIHPKRINDIFSVQKGINA